MPDLFISYSRRNKDFVQRLHNALSERDRDVWVDWEDIPPSVEWWKEIERGIESANAFIFVISPASAQSEICYREVEHAFDNNKRIVPLVHQEVSGELIDKMHPSIGAHNWIFFNDPAQFDASFETLAETLNTDFDYVRDHTRLQVRALEWERNDHDEGFLLRGEALMEAEQWLAGAASKEPAPSALHTEYIITSQLSRARYQRTRFAFVTGALIVTAILALIAVFQTFEAEANADEAERNANAQATSAAIAERRLQVNISQQFAAESEDALDANDTQLAILLALDSIAAIEPPQPESLLALANAAYAPGVREQFPMTDSVLSLDADNTLVVTGDTSGTLRAQDIQTEAEVFAVALDDSGLATLDMDGDRVVVGTDDGEVILYNVAQQAEVLRWVPHVDGDGFPLALFDVAIQGDRIVTASDGAQAALWDTAGNLLLDYSTFYVGDPDAVINAVDFAPQGDKVALGGVNLIIAGTDTRNAQYFVPRLSEDFHGDPITALAFSTDGDQIVTGSLDTSLKVWDLIDNGVDDREIRLRRTLEAHTEAISHIEYDSAGFTFATASVATENAIILWNTSTLSERARLLQHNDTVQGMAFLNEGLRLLSGGLDRDVYFWDAENGALVRRLTGQLDDIAAVAFSDDGRYAAAGSDDSTVFVWDLTTGERVATLAGHTADVQALAFATTATNNAPLLASAGDDATIIIWDVLAGQNLRTMTGHTSRIEGIAFSPDGLVLASASRDRTVRLWSVLEGEEIAVLEGHRSVVNDVAFSPDGSRLLSGSKDRSVILWGIANRIADSEPLTTFSDIGRGQVTSVAFAPDGRTALVGDSERMFLLDIADGDIIRLYRGHRSTITDVAFSSDGTLALSASADADIVLWDVETGEERLRLEGHRASVNSVAFDPTGTRALSGSSDDTAVLWRIDTVNDLIVWLFNNRVVEREYTCTEREEFGLQPCDAETGIFPTRTPFLTATPGFVPEPTTTPDPMQNSVE
jgi:WD40 repeat protein